MSFKEIYFQNLDESISCVDFSPTGDYMAAGLIDEKVIVWKTGFENIEKPSLEEIYKWDGHCMGVIDVKFNYKGDRLAVSSLDSCLRVWDLDQGNKISEIVGSPMSVWKLGFLSDGKTTVTSGELGKITSYDIETQDSINSVDTTEVFSSVIATSCNGKFVATGNASGQVFLNDTTDGWRKFNFDCHNKMVRGLSFTQDCLKLVTGSDDMSAKVLDLVKMEPIMTFQGHKGNINSVDCSPVSNNLFITASYDKTIKLWDLNSKTCVETINLHTDNVWSAKFNSTGNIIGSVCENGVIALHSKQ